MGEIEEETRQKRAVRCGLEYILGHFKPPYFPRKVSTAATYNGQRSVNSIEEAMSLYEQAGYQDCRIQAFAVNQTNPNLIFIEFDGCDFGSLQAFKLGLTATLKRIDKEIGGHPTVLWSGRGYHVILPIDCTMPLENVKELADLEPETSNNFLRFAERYLSANKRDKSHHPALKSCGLRIPSSINSRCYAAGLSHFQVKVLREWDGKRPDIRLLLGSFHSYLVERKLERMKIAENAENGKTNKIKRREWIERLLQTGIDDHRKNLIFWVLAPYLASVRHLEYSAAYAIIEEWLDKCNAINPLQPSYTSFRYIISNSLRTAQREKRWPCRFDTFKKIYPAVSLSH